MGTPNRQACADTLGQTFVDPTNRNRVAVLMDVSDMGAFMGAMESQDAANAMAHDGVLPETLVVLVEASE